MADLVFNVTLDETSYQKTMGGWLVPAMTIPGAVIEGVFAEGSRVDDRLYRVDSSNQYLLWPAEQPRPNNLAVQLRLTKALSRTEDVEKQKTMAEAWKANAEKWKFYAAIIALIAAIVSAYMTFARGSYPEKSPPEGPAKTSQGGVLEHVDCRPHITEPVNFQEIVSRGLGVVRIKAVIPEQCKLIGGVRFFSRCDATTQRPSREWRVEGGIDGGSPWEDVGHTVEYPQKSGTPQASEAYWGLPLQPENILDDGVLRCALKVVAILEKGNEESSIIVGVRFRT